MDMDDLKTKQLLAYIVQQHLKASVTVLMKISYLIDLISVKKHGHQVTSFAYTRYNFGPFDKKIYTLINELEAEGIITGESNYTFEGDEYLIFSLNKDNEDFSFDTLTEPDIKIADDVLEQLRGYGAKTLTDITYKTAPMKKLGATQGGNEHLNEALDLSCD